MSMAQLVAAGAPELPEGHFYRVCRVLAIGHKVEIREQRRFTSSFVADSYVLEEHHDDMTEAVVAACRRAHDKARRRMERRGKGAVLDAFVGDHDPKGGR